MTERPGGTGLRAAGGAPADLVHPQADDGAGLSEAHLESRERLQLSLHISLPPGRVSARESHTQRRGGVESSCAVYPGSWIRGRVQTGVSQSTSPRISMRNGRRKGKYR